MTAIDYAFGPRGVVLPNSSAIAEISGFMK
jgi:hypothetical protein